VLDTDGGWRRGDIKELVADCRPAETAAQTIADV
jgi:hypothetical protein